MLLKNEIPIPLTGTLLLRVATVKTAWLEVKRSASKRTIIIKPMGKTRPSKIFSNPGVLVESQGSLDKICARSEPKARKRPFGFVGKKQRISNESSKVSFQSLHHNLQVLNTYLLEKL